MPPRHREDGFDFLDRAQFDVDRRRKREEFHEQRAPPREPEAVRATFCRMPHRHDQREFQARQRGQKRARIFRKMIHAELEKIDAAGPQLQRALERAG